MSLQLAIPSQVGLHQNLSPLHQPESSLAQKSSIELSMYPFSSGLPGRMKHSCTPLWIAQAQAPGPWTRCVIQGDALRRRAMLFDGPFQRSHHVTAVKRAIRFQRNALSGNGSKTVKIQ